MAKTKAAAKLPLFFHKGSGQWVKKIRGKTRYFGTDKEAAFAKWQSEQAYTLAGVEPLRHQQTPSLSELGNVYADYLRRTVASGELSERTAGEYKRSIARLIEIVGPDCRIGTLKPGDFGEIKERLSDPVMKAKGSARHGGRTVSGPKIEA